MNAPAQRPRADWGVVLTVQALLLGPMALLFLAGHVEPSAQARRGCLPVWIVLGLVLFAWTTRSNLRRIAGRGAFVSPGARLAIAAVHAVLCGIATVTLALALPAIPHHWMARTQDVQTFVTGKTTFRGRSTSYCLATPDFDTRIQPVQWCTRRAIFDQAHVGEAILLHGTTSWFGFKRDHFDLVPTAPDREVPKAGFLPAAVPSPVVMTAAPVADPVEGPAVGAPLQAWPGDDLAKLQAAYPRSPAPTPNRSGSRDNQQVLHLADRGLWFFLTADGTVNTVRIGQPFTEAVDGVRLGDTLDAAQRALGAEGTRIDGEASYVFATAAAHRLRVDLDAAQRVQTIFIFR